MSPSQSDISQLEVSRRAQSVLLAQNTGHENLIISGTHVGYTVGTSVGTSVGVTLYML